VFCRIDVGAFRDYQLRFGVNCCAAHSALLAHLGLFPWIEFGFRDPARSKQRCLDMMAILRKTMTIYSRRYMQRVVDQAAQRFANGETDLLSAVSLKDADGDLLRRLMLASAIAARDAGESIAQWRERQSRRIARASHHVLDNAVAVLERSGSEDLGPLIEGLEADGIRGLSGDADALSTDPWTDVPTFRPIHRAPATWAGVYGTALSPNLEDDAIRLLSCVVDVDLKLPADQRGAHMSRMQSALLETEKETYADVEAYVRAIGSAVSKGQPNVGVRLSLMGEVRFPIVSHVTKRPSAVRGKIEIDWELDASGSVDRVCKMLELDIATACPCTLRYSRLSGARDLGLATPEGMPPTFTHSQPGRVCMRVAPKNGARDVGFADMAQAAGTGTHLREMVLKRPDEHALVERIHRRPQFAEDVVRSVAMELAAYADEETSIEVSAVLDESIHPHKAAASIAGLARDFWQTDAPAIVGSPPIVNCRREPWRLERRAYIEPFEQRNLERFAARYGHPSSKDCNATVWPIQPRTSLGTFSETDGEARLHTDAQYRTDPESSFVLICEKPAKEGGTSILLPADDARAIARDQLGKDGFHALTQPLWQWTVPEVFRLPNGHTLSPAAPIFEASGAMRWRFDNLSALSDELMDIATAFDMAINTSDAIVQVDLEAGDVLHCDNRFALHGRTTFTDRARLLYRIRLT